MNTPKELKVGEKYDLKIQYSGIIQESLKGFYKAR